MCGLAGFSLSPHDASRVDVSRLAESLLGAIEPRGPHATGVAWVDDVGVMCHKKPVRASQFIDRYGTVPSGVSEALLHARYATHGSPEDSRNNHPLQVGSVVGVHNGVVFNTSELFRGTSFVERLDGVDSEAVFALLAGSRQHPVDLLSRVDGSATVAWYDNRYAGDLQVARVMSSPLVTAFTADESFLFASTSGAITETAELLGLVLRSLTVQNEGTYLRVRAGQVVEQRTFVAERSYGALNDMERAALNLS
jgi:glucosamine 6-phosphate synthetase-like amidotransferase/phosphosugar isomerase protein